MIVSANSDKLAKAFMEFQVAFERKLKNVARGFAYKITDTAIKNTPLGDAQQYMSWYKRREESIGLNPQQGFARGSWQANQSGQFTVQTIYGNSSGTQALTMVNSSLGNINLWQNIYIGNRGYYIKMLENNYSEQTQGLGIMKPTQDMVLATYAIDIKELYDKG